MGRKKLYKTEKEQKEARKMHNYHYRQQHPEKFKLSKTKNRQEKTQWLKNFKKTQSCMDCGFDDYRALDFHHRLPSIKVDGISKLVNHSASYERILIEIAKCDVLCANCHRIRHYIKRENSKKWAIK